MPRSSKRFLSFRFPILNPELSFVLYTACHMPSSSHHSLFRHTNNILRGLHHMKLLVVRFSRTYCDTLVLNYLTQAPVLELPQPMSVCEWLSLTPV